MPRLLLLCCLVLSAPFALAQGPSAAKAGELPAWEQLSPQQRELLLAPVRDRWNNSAPDKRRHMLDHAQRWQSMTPEERNRARHGHKRWQDMPPEKRHEARALFEQMRGKSETERKALVEEWRKMTPEQRKAWVEAHPPKQREE